MAVTTAVLSGTITDVIGDLNPALLGRVVLAIEANTEGSLLLDTSGDRLMAGAKRITVDKQTGAYSATLVRTDSTDVIPSGGRLYRAYLQYPSGIPGAGNVQRYSGWFELTTDGSLSDADKWPGLEVTAVTDAVVASIGDMQADVETRHAAVMGVVATNEGIMTSVLGSGGTFDDELSATYVAQADLVPLPAEVEVAFKQDSLVAAATGPIAIQLGAVPIEQSVTVSVAGLVVETTPVDDVVILGSVTSGQRIHIRYAYDAAGGAATDAVVKAHKSDSFTRADSTTTLGTSDSGDVWSVPLDRLGGQPVFGISTNRAYPVTNPNNDAYAYIDAGAHDYIIQGKFSVIGGSQGLTWRSNNTPITGYATTLGAAYKRDSTGTVTPALNTFNIATFGNNDTMRVVVKGNTHSVYRQVASVGPFVLVGEFTDTTYPTGQYVGIRFGSGSSAARTDDFYVVPL